jgi:hypothetical protein
MITSVPGKIPADQQQAFEIGADQHDHDAVAVEIAPGDVDDGLFRRQIERDPDRIEQQEDREDRERKRNDPQGLTRHGPLDARSATACAGGVRASNRGGQDSVNSRRAGATRAIA